MYCMLCMLLHGFDAIQYIVKQNPCSLRKFEESKKTQFAIQNIIGWAKTGTIKFDKDRPKKTRVRYFETSDREVTLFTRKDEFLAD